MDINQIPTGILGEKHDEFSITDQCRVSIYVDNQDGINVLERMMATNYLSSGIPAIIFGIRVGLRKPLYAVYIHPDYIKDSK